jgi:hypothetical protein
MAQPHDASNTPGPVLSPPSHERQDDHNMSMLLSSKRNDLKTAEGMIVSAAFGLALWAGVFALCWVLHLLWSLL